MEVSAENAAGGFILPDDHVDVVLTRHDKSQQAGGSTDRVVSETILRNVRVLAIDQAVEEKAGQKVVVGKTATLELVPDQAEALQLARQQGTLTLALRSLADSQENSSDDDDSETSKKRGPINTVRYGVSSVSVPR
jgi:pilus assembly protein CpaB